MYDNKRCAWGRTHGTLMVRLTVLTSVLPLCKERQTLSPCLFVIVSFSAKHFLQAKAPVVISPDCPIHLLGRDLMQLLQIGVIPTPIMLTEEEETELKVTQYPLIADAFAGIQPVIKQLLHAGVIRECPDSPCNTPIFPVRKADATNWRMVQDLRQINEAVQSRAPLVSDPHTLLNTLRPENTFFTVTDLSNAFFSIPVHPDSQFWFAFTYAGKSYTYTRLPQIGYRFNQVKYNFLIWLKSLSCVLSLS
uniref:ribonuclease H n=1 Tax=Sparus aurata TaxID=8175 RepID=A0A671VP81_SPAAU